MKLPKIEGIYNLNQSLKQNNYNKPFNLPVFLQENLNNNINMSNIEISNNNNSSKIIPRIFSDLEITEQQFDTEENLNKNINNENKDKSISSKNINSYINIPFSKKSKSINFTPSLNRKKTIIPKKKINIINSSDNLFINKNIDDNNEIKILLNNNIKKNKDLNLNNEKDEDKTILPFSSKILNFKQKYKNNIKRYNFSDISNFQNEINKDNSRKKLIYNRNSNEKYHEHYIFFNNCYFRNNSWKNNLLKNLLPNLKERGIKKSIKDKQKKEKIHKKKFKFRNDFDVNKRLYNNYQINSFFNNEINNFYNNYINNNKDILPIKKEKGNTIEIKINHTKNSKNIFSNSFSPFKIMNKKNLNSSLMRNLSKDLTINIGSLYNIKNYE